jgi:hypothetical protein
MANIDAGQSLNIEGLLAFFFINKEKPAMKHTALRVVGLPAALLVLTLGAGCATDDAMKAAQDAKSTADQANRTALQASADAKAAKDEAAAARAAAEAAQRSADEAKAAAQMTNEKIDRAFKKAVQK